jgi:outer membrane lipoprotein SlyB
MYTACRRVSVVGCRDSSSPQKVGPLSIASPAQVQSSSTRDVLNTAALPAHLTIMMQATSSMRTKHTPRGGSIDDDEFASVLHPASASSTASSSSARGVDRKTQLSDQQLYDRIEEQLEQLDKKRLTLQQLVSRAEDGGDTRARGTRATNECSPTHRPRSCVSVSCLQLRSYHETPYSSRIARSVESTRVDSGRLAKKIHNLFKFIPSVATSAAPPAADRSTIADATLTKFQPLFQNYAAVSRILNATCMESLAYEAELAQRAATKRKITPDGSPAAPSSARRRQAGTSQHTPYDPPIDASSMDDDAIVGREPLESSTESLPLLEVNGLDSYESSKKQGDFMNLQSMVLDIAQSFHALASITAQQQELVDVSESHVQQAKEKSLAAELELRKASRYKAFGLVVAGGVTGAAIGGPLGALVGLKTGLSIGVGIGLMGAGGALIGAAAGKQIQRARFVPLSHLDEQQEGAEMSAMAAREREIKAAEASASTSSTRSASASNSPAQTEEKRSCIRKCL